MVSKGSAQRQRRCRIKVRQREGLVAVMLAGAVLLPSLSPADIKRPETESEAEPLPLAQPVTVTVLRGQSVMIPLKAVTGSSKGVEFVMRSEPRYGVLGELNFNERINSEAEVVYTSIAPAGIREDRFTYAARFSGKRVSAAAEVIIRIEEPAPRLEMPEGLGFGTAMLGESKRATLRIRNSGTGAYDASLELPAPWTGPKRLRIEPGETVDVPLLFKPSKPGGHAHQLVLAEGAGGRVTLQGEGLAPFSAAVGRVDLQWNRAERRREGTLAITNLTGEAREIRTGGDARLQVPASVRVDAGSRVEIAVRLDTRDVEAFEAALELESDGYRESVIVAAAPAPAFLVGDPASSEGFHFGFVPQGVERSHAFVFRNGGGLTTPVQVEVSGPFHLSRGEGRLVMEPGQRAEFVVGMDTATPGPWSGELTVTSTGQEFRIPLRGTVMARRQAREESPSLQGRAFATMDGAGETASPAAWKEDGEEGAEGEELAPLGADYWKSFIARPERKKEFTAAVPTVPQIYLEEIGRTALELSWEPVGGEYHYVVEMRAMRYDAESQQLVAVWAPHKQMRFQENSGRVHARMEKLSPDARQVFRIFTVNPLGEYSLPTAPGVVWTQPAATMPWRKVLLGTVTVLLGLLCWLKWHRSRVDRGAYAPA